MKKKHIDDLVNQEKNNNNVEVDLEEGSISRTSSDESIDEPSGIVNKTNKNKNDDQEEDSSDESNVILPKLIPLTIGTKTVHTQEIALSVDIDGKKYSNSMLQKKHCMLKRGSYKGVEVPYIVNDVYINKDNDGYFYDISNTNELK